MRRSLLFVAALPWLLGCSSTESSAPADRCPPFVSSSTPPPKTSLFDLAFIHDDATARAILQCAARDAANDVDTSGAFAANTKDKGLVIEAQRGAWDLISGGVALDDEELADAGLRAIEWGFRSEVADGVAGPEGSWPAERDGDPSGENSLHPKSEFLFAAARAALLLRDASIGARFRDRLEKLEEPMRRSGSWMLGSKDTTKFFASAGLSNQLFFVAVGIHDAGLFTGDGALVEGAAPLFDEALGHVTSAGVIPEKGGFDASYQTVSLELVASYAADLADGHRRASILPVLDRATDRFLSAVRSDGTLVDRGNTRTVACGAPVPGKVANGGPGCSAKGHDVDIIPLRVRFLGELLGKSATLDPISDEIECVGQGFDHDGSCDD